MTGLVEGFVVQSELVLYLLQRDGLAVIRKRIRDCIECVVKGNIEKFGKPERITFGKLPVRVSSFVERLALRSWWLIPRRLEGDPGLKSLAALVAAAALCLQSGRL